MVVWDRLIRFKGVDGKIYFGQPIIEQGQEDIDALANSGTLKAAVIEGNDIFANSARVTSNVQGVRKLLGPLTASEVPIIRCVGLNYMKHIEEGGRKPPPYPSMFIKPADCVADHDSVVYIPPLAQEEQLDYEGELVSRATPHVSRLCTATPRYVYLTVVYVPGPDSRDRHGLQRRPTGRSPQLRRRVHCRERPLGAKMATRSRLRRRCAPVVLLQRIRPICAAGAVYRLG